MVTLRVERDQLHVQLSGWEKAGALSGDISVPVSSIVKVTRLETCRSAIRGLRAPGTGVPWLIALGRFRTRRTTDFVAVYRNNPGYEIELHGERLDRIVASSPPVAQLDALR